MPSSPCKRRHLISLFSGVQEKGSAPSLSLEFDFHGFVGGHRDLSIPCQYSYQVVFPCLLLAACAVLSMSKKGSGYSICAYAGCNLRAVVAHPLCGMHTLEQDSALFSAAPGVEPCPHCWLLFVGFYTFCCNKSQQ